VEGTVAWFSGHFGYGFIKGEDGRDYFSHWSFIDAAGYRTLPRGGKVSFDPHQTLRGWQARNVKLSVPEENEQGLVLRANPFTPHQPVTDPTKFAGRRDPLRNAVDAIFNRKGVFVNGARGIGKTSLANQLKYLAQGEKYLLENLNITTNGYEFNYLVLHHQCFPGQQISDLCAGLILSLQAQLQGQRRVTETKVKHGIDIKFYQGSIEQTSTSSLPLETVGRFIFDLEDAWDALVAMGHNGLCLFIDELDWLGPEVPVAFFLKNLTERLRLDGYLDTCFIIAGDTSYLTTLMTQHQSSLRLFESVPVSTMTEAESHEVLARTLADSSVDIEESAANRIVELSAGFPTPVHQLGYHSFRLDQDNSISSSDVQRALTHVVGELRNEEFSHQRSKLALGHEETLVLLIARAPAEEVSLDYILWKTGIDIEQIGSALTSAERKGFIVRGRREAYRIREPLFRLYLRWKEGLQ
jgi:CspA family cold shock protein